VLIAGGNLAAGSARNWSVVPRGHVVSKDACGSWVMEGAYPYRTALDGHSSLRDVAHGHTCSNSDLGMPPARGRSRPAILPPIHQPENQPHNNSDRAAPPRPLAPTVLSGTWHPVPNADWPSLRSLRLPRHLPTERGRVACIKKRGHPGHAEAGRRRPAPTSRRVACSQCVPCASCTCGLAGDLRSFYPPA